MCTDVRVSALTELLAQHIWQSDAWRGGNMSKRYIALALLVAIVIASLYLLAIVWQKPTGLLPRDLAVGDMWTYKIVFPDSKSYQMTESVKAVITINGTEVYLLFRDDAQHISTQYFWVTSDWHEIRTFTPSIGNLLANSTITYTPPVKLFQIPLRVGDQWTVKSTKRAITIVKNMTIDSNMSLQQIRTTTSFEEVLTPVGRFHAFKVTVVEDGSLSEALWFSAGLGEVVYGEFYNDHERVTQTLIGYKLDSQSTSAVENMLVQLDVETRLFQHSRGWKAVASYI